MRRHLLALLVGVALLVSLLAFASPAAAAAPKCTSTDFPLHAKTGHGKASCGQHVADLQWLLHGGKPYVFHQVKPTFKGKPNGSYGAITKHAVLAMKFRIGYPAKGQCGAKTSLLVDTTTRYFFSILEGKATRPTCWVALAASRVKAVNVGPTAAALRIRTYELHLVTLNIHEQPESSNRGPCISVSCGSVPALQSATGAYGQAWCVSAQQTISLLLGYGTFAGDTANVYAAADDAAAHNLTSAKPKVGALVAFVEYGAPGQKVDSKGRVIGSGHMGFVTDVYANSFTYTAGNDGNAFRKHTIEMGSRSYVFIYRPGIT